MKTINGKTDGFIGEDKIYIGRYNKYYNLNGSPLHNPFAIVKGVNTRKDVINQYKLHAIKAVEELQIKGILNPFMKEVIRLIKREKELQSLGKELLLVCWCKPYDCHGDIIIQLIKWLETQEWFKVYINI